MTYSIFELVKEVRKRITSIDPELPVRYALMNCYLLATRASETVYYPYGPAGNDAHEEILLNPSTGKYEKVAVFCIKTAKKNGQLRYTALPLSPEYEPLTRELFDYYKMRGSKPCFPFSHRTLLNYARNVFTGLSYQIEAYYNSRKDVNVEPHERKAAVHFLRHVRASELATLYDFDENQLRLFGGWNQAVMTGSSVILRYRQLTWKDYIHLLMRPSPYVELS